MAYPGHPGPSPEPLPGPSPRPPGPGSYRPPGTVLGPGSGGPGTRDPRTGDPGIAIPGTPIQDPRSPRQDPSRTRSGRVLDPWGWGPGPHPGDEIFDPDRGRSEVENLPPGRPRNPSPEPLPDGSGTPPRRVRNHPPGGWFRDRFGARTDPEKKCEKVPSQGVRTPRTSPCLGVENIGHTLPRKKR